MKIENYTDVLFGFDGIHDEGTELYSMHEVADFIFTHNNGGLITEKDGTPLLEFESGEIFDCGDMQYKDKLMIELRKGEGFEDRYKW